jgi:hypothetical protein
MGILTNIRNRPENQKKVLALVLAAILTMIIVGFWFSFSPDSTDKQISGQKQNKLSSISPWQMIKDEFSKAFSNFKTVTDQDLSLSSSTASSSVAVEIVEEATSTEEF